MKIATSVVAAALLSATAAWAGDPGVSDTEIKIGDVNIMTGPAAFVGRGVSLGSKIAAGEINAAGGVITFCFDAYGRLLDAQGKIGG